jgi:hypothetical protein
VFGAVHVHELTLASEVIFAAPTVAVRRQRGCVRFSALAAGSRTPRRYRCQPDLAMEGLSDPARIAAVRNRLRPTFTSLHYGDPAFAQLSLNAAREITQGAENGSEMGAFERLLQPQRVANLRLRLDEYLPFGRDPGLIDVT